MPGALRLDKTFFDLHLYLVGKFCKNSKVPGAQLNVNRARAITWFGGVAIYCTFFNNNSLPPRQFLCNKALLKKKATVRGMLIEQIFELRRPRSLGRRCTFITVCFHDKTIISKENIRLDCYLLLKYCRRQMCFTSPYLGQITYKTLPQNATFKKFFGLKLQAKVGLNNLIFSMSFQMLKI